MGNFINNTNLVLLSDDDYNWTCNHSFEEIINFGSIDSNRWNNIEPLFDDEVWKSMSVCGCNNYYVSNYGRVYQKEYSYEYENRYGSVNKTTQKHRIVRNILLTNGYYNVVVYNNHKKKNLYVHRLVCYMFNQMNRPSKFEFDKTEEYNIVDHKDSIRTNNIAANLVWSNFKANMNNEITLKKMSDAKINTNPNRQKYQFDNYDGRPTDDFNDYVQNESSRWFSLVDFKDEVWKQISDINQIAYVSSYGRIKKLFHNKEDKMYVPHYTLNNSGYFVVYIDNRPFLVHRLVYETFNSQIDNNKIIDHIDTNRLNNQLNNLREVSHAENSNNILSVEKNKRHRTVINKRPVVLYSLETGKRISEFESQMECARYVNTKARSVGSTLDKQYIIQNKYIAIFKEYEEEFVNTMLKDFILRSIDKYTLSGKYICTYNSAYEITSSNDRRKKIYSCCNNKKMSCMGYQWKWSDGTHNDIAPAESINWGHNKKYSDSY